MAASDNLNPQQFERYGGGYYAQPPNVAVASQRRYTKLADAATTAAQAESRRKAQIRRGA